MFTKTNLKEALDQEKQALRSVEANVVLDQAFTVLADAYCNDLRIKGNLEGRNTKASVIPTHQLDPELIYSEAEIKRLCIAYRLRFLDTKQFKGEIPQAAIAKISALEKTMGIELKNFKIIAPSERFTLEDCDKDPLLFLELSNGYHYLIHQWGNDLAWYRKWLMWPLRSFATLGTTIAVISLSASLFIPTSFISSMGASGSLFPRFAFFVWILACITAAVTYIGFAFFKNLSAYEWNSPFFKQDF